VSARSLRAGAFCRNPELSGRRISGQKLPLNYNQPRWAGRNCDEANIYTAASFVEYEFICCGPRALSQIRPNALLFPARAPSPNLGHDSLAFHGGRIGQHLRRRGQSCQRVSAPSRHRERAELEIRLAAALRLPLSERGDFRL